MTYQVKEGGVLEYRGDGSLKSGFSFKKGKAYKIEYDGYVFFIRDECGIKAFAIFVDLKAYGFHPVPFTPPETIQHGGYNYTRGEPVIPEWLKDGAWVVNVVSGDLRQVEEFSPGKFSLITGTTVSIRYGDHLSDQYRPHEPSDYKWGDWAMYGGEKVFVMRREKEGYISVSHPDFSNGRGIVKVSELNPTTAP